MITTLILLALTRASAPAEGQPRVADVVVSLDAGTIHHSRIACPPAVASDRPRCHSLEQSRLDVAVWQYWIMAAAPMYGLGLTSTDEAAITEYVAAQRTDNQRSAAHFHALWINLGRIFRGEDPQAVYALAIKEGVSRQELDEQVAGLLTGV